MKIYEVIYLNEDGKDTTQVLTAESEDSLDTILDEDVIRVECHGPYINDSVYQELRKEIIDA